MLDEIQSVLDRIREENLERIKLFRKLVEMFALILEQENEEHLLRVAVRELREFLGVDVSIHRAPPSWGRSYEIRAGIFSEGEIREEIVGYLTFGTEDTTPELEDFFRSVTKMLSFQIEKLNMLKAQSYLREKAEAASKAKSMFIANMSHELRTPLNAIIGFAQYLRSELDPNSVHGEVVRNIEVSGRHLLTMINDILDFSKAEAGKVKVRRERFNLRELLEEVEVMVRHSAQRKGLDLRMEKPDIEIETDPGLLKQVLINLLFQGHRHGGGNTQGASGKALRSLRTARSVRPWKGKGNRLGVSPLQEAGGAYGRQDRGGFGGKGKGRRVRLTIRALKGISSPFSLKG